MWFDVNPAPDEAWLARTAGRAVLPGVTVQKDEPALLLGHPAREMRLLLPPPLGPVTQQSKLGAIGSRVYQVTATTPPDQVTLHAAQIQRFFDSFQLMK